MDIDKEYMYTLSDLEFQFALKEKSSDDKNQFVLGPLNFRISKGKLTSILGRSGSGKTTLLSLIGLLREQSHGQIKVGIKEEIDTIDLWKRGDEIEAFRAKNIGFALQKGELLPHLTMFENAALVPRFLGIENSIIEEKLKYHFEELYAHENNQGQLAKIMNSKPNSVSQGQYQRGAIVRALAADPAIILADEPTGNLDQRSGEEAMRIFRRLIRDKEYSRTQSVIVVTHDVLLAIDYADEIIVLKNGQQSAHLTKEDEKWSDSNGNFLSDQETIEKILNEYL